MKILKYLITLLVTIVMIKLLKESNNKNISKSLRMASILIVSAINVVAIIAMVSYSIFGKGEPIVGRILMMCFAIICTWFVYKNIRKYLNTNKLTQ
ncbi:MAG: hypothetical protein Q4E02_04745 [Lagierella massiliensis]|nr:hypothetical protein [Lagierella massiliensis]